MAAQRTVKIGIVSPETGPMAGFAEPTAFVVRQVLQAMRDKITINGKTYPFQIIVKDTQSSPNRAADVALELIQRDKVDMVLSYGGPETANPASDQCELNGVPSLSTAVPIEPWFYGRGGDPKTGFDWTYIHFFDGATYANSILSFIKKVSTNKTMGGLWPNDADGIALSKAFSGVFGRAGYRIVDPGRFDLPASTYSTQIAAFKAANCELAQCVVPPSAFALFWDQCAQQGFHPKVMIASKSSEYPPSVKPLGERARGIGVPIWFTRAYPFKSTITGQGATEIIKAYEAASGRQWAATLGSTHAMLEVMIDALNRTKDINDRASVRDALKATKMTTLIGNVDFSKGSVPNASPMGVVMVQWDKAPKGSAYPLDMFVVDNAMAPAIPVDRAPFPIPYA
ncbi:ABC transporter substrate-binding protein [Paraburkholderia dipogonis]|uniref:ABC transporter substrate-binding protein n=1 Tax=Paraburkholderia dipogonis TaxID=1211383 RepID=A0A4Y8MGI4_9BURK|nr:ABC transporter substrate-binding protein [Paraburkholderia dipogonis]TFE36503.1 ABC transporter substrate-binding protein [Paraburkholderia dipogonis]